MHAEKAETAIRALDTGLALPSSLVSVIQRVFLAGALESVQ